METNFHFINLMSDSSLLREYIRLCSTEWGSPKNEIEMKEYIQSKEKDILEGDKVISVIGLTEGRELIGFISLFRYEVDPAENLTPWYATMYVKKEYRGHGYSRLLNDEILKEAKRLGYKKVYLKTELKNYYEKFGAIYLRDLNENERVLYFDI